MNFRIIIPARYASVRLPGKALCEIGGKPMIQQVYERACKSDAVSVIVATDDKRIAGVCKEFGAPVCLTSAAHLSGADRIAEAAALMKYDIDDIIVNVQGDQPLIPYENINQAAKNLLRQECVNIATLCERIHEESDLSNPAVVKTTRDMNNHAIYFSRSLIPWVKKIDLQRQIYYKHVGLYAYRAKTILKFANFPAPPLELSESLEQLRFLFQGEKIHVDIAVKSSPIEVNTPEDLEKIRRLFLREF